MRVLFCGSGWLPIVDAIRARLAPGDEIVIWDRTCPLATALTDAEVVLPSNARLGADAIATAGHLRLIHQPAAGYEGIDLEAAQARGIPVCNTPGANQVAVAEAALLLLLSLARRVPVAARAFAHAEIGVPVGIELAGRTLGVIGAGRTGSTTRAHAAALGMHTRTLGRDATPDERRAFFGACDAIAIHCPLTAATRGLINDAAFAAMRPGALLVNLARGAIIERAALDRALASGRLGGLGLDVFWDEPWDPTDPLFRDPRVVALPHIAGSTEEAFARIADAVVGNLDRLARGAPLVDRVA
jgi:phosphoglycerate dehydrogenase-like enzyme